MKNLVLRKMGEYTLIARVKEDNTVHEYVVAWCYDSESDSWCQGHYFSYLEDATYYMENKTMTQFGKRQRLLQLMHDYIKDEVDDEEAYESWINIVPDEPSQGDFLDIACDEDLWKHCAKKFGRLVRMYEQGTTPTLQSVVSGQAYPHYKF